MKDKYSILNHTKVNLDKYENVDIQDINKEAVKNRLILKLEPNNKKVYSKFIKVATITAILISSIMIVNDDAQALMLRVGNNIESFLNKDKSELDKYKTVVNQKSTSNGVNISLNEVMFNNDELLLNLNIDVKKYIKDNLGKSEKCIAYPSIFKIEINGEETYAITKSIYILKSSDDTGDYLITTKLGNKDLIKKYIKENNVDLKIESNNLFLEIMDEDYYNDSIEGTSRMTLGIIPSEDKTMDETLKKIYDYKTEDSKSYKVAGSWNFKTNIDISKSISDTKTYEINKSIDVKHKDFGGKIIIDRVSVSPATVKVSYKIKADTDCKVDISETEYLPLIDIKNQDGTQLEELSSDGYSNDDGTSMYESEYNLKSTDKKLKITPGIDFFSRIYFEDRQINIELE